MDAHVNKTEIKMKKDKVRTNGMESTKKQKVVREPNGKRTRDFT